MVRNSTRLAGISFSHEPPKYGWGRCPACGSTTEPDDGVCFVCGCPATWRQIERVGERMKTFNPCPDYPRHQRSQGVNPW